MRRMSEPGCRASWLYLTEHTGCSCYTSCAGDRNIELDDEFAISDVMVDETTPLAPANNASTVAWTDTRVELEGPQF